MPLLEQLVKVVPLRCNLIKQMQLPHLPLFLILITQILAHPLHIQSNDIRTIPLGPIIAIAASPGSGESNIAKWNPIVALGYAAGIIYHLIDQREVCVMRT